MTNEIARYVWIIECHNDFCSGPKKWAVMDEKPVTPLHCPTCGWLALPGSGIEKLDQIEAGEDQDDE